MQKRFLLLITAGVVVIFVNERTQIEFILITTAPFFTTVPFRLRLSSCGLHISRIAFSYMGPYWMLRRSTTLAVFLMNLSSLSWIIYKNNIFTVRSLFDRCNFRTAPLEQIYILIYKNCFRSHGFVMKSISKWCLKQTNVGAATPTMSPIPSHSEAVLTLYTVTQL